MDDIVAAGGLPVQYLEMTALGLDREGSRLAAIAMHLYSVHGDRSEATAFTIEPKSGHLKVLNRQPTGGYNVIHLDFDASGRFLVVANYGTDSTAVLPIARDGSLRPYSTLTTVVGTNGPHRREQNNIR